MCRLICLVIVYVFIIDRILSELIILNPKMMSYDIEDDNIVACYIAFCKIITIITHLFLYLSSEYFYSSYLKSRPIFPYNSGYQSTQFH